MKSCKLNFDTMKIQSMCFAFLACFLAFPFPESPGQSSVDPNLGFVYPAGGQRGQTFEITLGGRNLRSAKGIVVTGSGIYGTIVGYHANHQRLYQAYLRDLGKAMNASLRGAEGVDGFEAPTSVKVGNRMTEVPGNATFSKLQSLSPKELALYAKTYRLKEGVQRNRQLDERVTVELTIEDFATIGDREIRLLTNTGLSNPLRFQVGSSQELSEREPNDRSPSNGVAPESPVTFNGQIMPGDVDRHRFTAEAGQTLVIEARARQLIPYLADAVPGWFQATLALRDGQGNELAFADDYRFSPDPVIFYEIPRSGSYEIAIRDAIYRGRSDFVYRISVGEETFITQMFPLGGQANLRSDARIAGWNLPSERIRLNTEAGKASVHRGFIGKNEHRSNAAFYAVDSLPEIRESAANDRMDVAQEVDFPVTLNGVIERPGDQDWIRFEGQAGQAIAVDVLARRLRSPLDSLIRLMDGQGNLLSWNDDADQENIGMLTHHADSSIQAILETGGVYYIQISDTRNKGGEEFAYRLRLSPPRPDFQVYAMPSSLTLGPGQSARLRFQVDRKEGFDGAIRVELAQAPEGFVLSGARFSETANVVEATLTAPERVSQRPFPIRLEARSERAGEVLVRQVVASDKVTQAFITPHIVPSEALMVYAAGARRWYPKVSLTDPDPLRLRAGERKRMKLVLGHTKQRARLSLKLLQAPEGIRLADAKQTLGGMVFFLEASSDFDSKDAGNVIIDAFAEIENNGKAGKKTRRISLGPLPAIPVERIQL